MTGSSTSPDTSVSHETVPAQRSSAERSALEHATTGLDAVRTATERLHREVSRLEDRELTRPSLLPGWTRAHVVTHLARNADALVNLLTWARTGIEHPMYESRADRDAAIEEGSQRLGQIIREDLLAACARLEVAAERMSGADWLAPVATRTGRELPAGDIPSMRLFEVWMHLVDLDLGVGVGDIEQPQLEPLLERATFPYADRPDGAPVRVRAELPDGRQRSWELAIPAAASGSIEISGSAADILGWLSRRADGSALTGQVPDLDAWG